MRDWPPLGQFAYGSGRVDREVISILLKKRREGKQVMTHKNDMVEEVITLNNLFLRNNYYKKMYGIVLMVLQ